MDKRKFRYQGINTLIRPTDEPNVEGIIEKAIIEERGMWLTNGVFNLAEKIVLIMCQISGDDSANNVLN
jgi:hypothetical protein